MKLPKVLRSRASQEREAYIADSLAPSKILSRQILDSSTSSNSKTRLHSMNFHKDWRHPECKVMKWYGLHTTTQFTSIQHWKNLDTQFYHEFLVIQLADGSACRVERMGEGSRTNAIRHIGCTAYDLIQWFSPDDNLAKKWSSGLNEMILQVEYPRSFDLLDILAICYTIQHKSRRGSVYTLQCYNCYFLCCTILVILARRAGSWEKLINYEDWTEITKEILHDLTRTSMVPVEEQTPVDYFAIGICSHLDPENPVPAGFMLDFIWQALDAGFGRELNEACAKALWHTQFRATPSEMDRVSRIGKMFNLAGSKPGSLAAELHALLAERNEERYPGVGLDHAATKQALKSKILPYFSSFAQRSASTILKAFRLPWSEERPRFRIRFMASALAPLAASLFPLVVYLAVKWNLEIKHDPEFDPWSDIGGAFKILQLASCIPFTARLEIFKYLVYSQFQDPSGALEYGFDIEESINTFLYRLTEDGAGLLSSVQLSGVPQDTLIPNTSTTLAFLNCYFNEDWWRMCLTHCLSTRVCNTLRSLLVRKPGILTIYTTGGERTELSVVGFQEHIQQRIKKHAQRVESAGLAPALAVHSDITISMSDVWKSLPPGLGGLNTFHTITLKV